jgi:acyl-CoA reductase-like NAD-dependent aldehyde dehydrogenase
MGHQPGELNHYFYEPRGLVLALTSSRRPLTSACAAAGAALAAGDPVVLKPGSRARSSTLLIARHLVTAGFPADAVGFVAASGDALGEELIAHPDVSVVAFSGTRPVALRVAAAVGRRGVGERVKRLVADLDPSQPRRPSAAYLVEFLEPRVVTENTLRRGFAPSEDLVEVAR